MVSLRVQLGFVPRTENLEQERKELQEEYEAFKNYAESEELKEFEELDQYINSPQFKEDVEHVKNQKYSETEEYRKEKEFNDLSQSKDIKNYYKIKNSSDLVEFRNFEKSEKLNRYRELEAYLNSEDFLKTKNYYSLPGKKRYEDTEDAKKEAEYILISKKNDIITYFSFVKNKGFQDFASLYGSDELKQFQELRDHVHSSEFLDQKASLKTKDWKNTSSYQEFLRYNEMRKNKKIKNYLKLEKKQGFDIFLKIYNSKSIEDFIKLRDEVNGKAFKERKKEIIRKKYKDTPEYEKEQAFKNLKNAKDIKNYFKFKDSALYRNFQQLDGSDRVGKYEELKNFVESEDFKKTKEYMLLSPSKKYKISEEHSKKERYEALKKSKDIKWYYRVKDSDHFAFLRDWDISFEDHFEEGKLDKQKWMTRYFWGDYFLNEPYSLSRDKHFVTDGHNLKIENSILTIFTKKEKITGKAWDTKLGFYPKDFEYTSGLISTGNSFRQKYGRFEAKIRTNKSYPVSHAFWMISDQMLPHIDVVKVNKKFSLGNYWKTESNGQVSSNIMKILTSKYSNDFYIYGLAWYPDKLIWTINDIVVDTQTSGVPQEPMYIILSSGIYKNNQNISLPAQLEIDWVRCYQHID